MLTVNNLYKVLVTEGNTTNGVFLGNEKKVSDLTPGKIGIFDIDTHKTFTAAIAPAVDRFYIATGKGKGDAYKGHDMSAGNFIGARNIKDVSLVEQDEGADQVLKITCKEVLCGVEHSITLEFFNSEIYRRQGFVQFTKTISTSIDPCDGNTDADAVGDPNLVLKELYLELKTIPEITTKIYESDGSTEKTLLTDIDSYITTHKAVNIDNDQTSKIFVIKITPKELKKERPGPINLKYYKIRKPFIKAKKCFGFTERLDEIVTTDTELKHSTGDGYDIRQLEYKAGGWDANPHSYKTYPMVGVTKNGFNYRSKVNAKYDCIHITYEIEDPPGYINVFTTIIAFNKEKASGETEQKTLKEFIAVLNPIIKPLGFAQLEVD